MRKQIQTSRNKTNSKKRKRHSRFDHPSVHLDPNQHQTPQTLFDSVAPSHENFNADCNSRSPCSTGGLPRKSPRSANQYHASSISYISEAEDQTVASFIEEDLDSHTANSQNDGQSRQFSSSDISNVDSSESFHSIHDRIYTLISDASELVFDFKSCLLGLIFYCYSMVEKVYPLFLQKLSISVGESAAIQYGHCYWAKGKELLNDQLVLWVKGKELLNDQLVLWNSRSSSSLASSVSHFGFIINQRINYYFTLFIQFVKLNIKVMRSNIEFNIEKDFNTMHNNTPEFMDVIKSLKSLFKSIKYFALQSYRSIKLKGLQIFQILLDWISILEFMSGSILLDWISIFLGYESTETERMVSIRFTDMIRSTDMVQKVNKLFASKRDFGITQFTINMNHICLRLVAEAKMRYLEIKSQGNQLKSAMLNLVLSLIQFANDNSFYFHQSTEYCKVQLQILKSNLDIHRSLDGAILQWNDTKSRISAAMQSFKLTFDSARQMTNEGSERLIAFASSFTFVIVDYITNTLTWLATAAVPVSITKAVLPTPSIDQTPEIEPETVLALACETWVSCHSKPTHVPVRDFQATLKSRLQSILGWKIHQTSTVETTSSSEALQ